MTKITHTFTTPRGAVVTLIADRGIISAEVNGKLHTSWNVRLGHDNTIGHHVVLAGNVRAAVTDIDAARKFFAASAAAYAQWKKDHAEQIANDQVNASWRLSDDMGRRYSAN